MKHERGDELVEERDGWEAWISGDPDAPDPLNWAACEPDSEMYRMWCEGEVYMIGVYPPGSSVGDRSPDLSLCGVYGYRDARERVIEMLNEAMADDRKEEQRWWRAASL